MPRKEENTRSVDRKSCIANYLNHLNEAEQDVEKALYEDDEPFARYKDWEQFVRIAISTQVLEKGEPGDTVKIRNRKGNLIFSAKNDKKKLPDSKHKDTYFHRALKNLNERAREHGRIHGKRHHGIEARRRRREEEVNASENPREENGNNHEQRSGRRRHQDEESANDNDREQNEHPRE